MIARLFLDAVQTNFRPYTFCVIALGVGLSCVLLKTSKIKTNFKLILYKWFLKKNVTYIVSSDKDVNLAIGALKRQICEKQILGLDCEWVSVRSSRRPVALLQLAAPNGVCSLFRLCSLQTIPSQLVELLENKSILKVGVAVVNDARYLLTDYGVRCEGCLDLRHLASQVGVEPRGLAYLANHLLGVELDKDWRVRCSDWEAETLSPVQIRYAAQDACIAVDIFEKLNHKKICQNYSWWTRIFWSKKDYWHHSFSLWSNYTGVNFASGLKAGSNVQVTSTRQPKRVDNIVKRNYNTLLHKDHYSNVFLLAPDNQVLCTISDFKAAWYISKELADVVSENPKTLKLRFEPSRRSTEPNGYYTKAKENKCVVCGSDVDLRRKNVVPSEYRKHFEETIKNHNSHDVLLLCLVCHVLSNMHDQTLREVLVKECDAPLGNAKNSKLVEVPDMRAVKGAARALRYSGDVIPEQRKAHLTSVICDKLNVSPDQLTKDFLQEITDINCFVESENYIPHGQKVVQHYETLGGVDVLQRQWRQHFLDTMHPHHLPQLWSVNYARD